MTTKPSKPVDLGVGSNWQMGPTFLSLPIRKDPVCELPDRLGVFVSHTKTNISDADLCNLFNITGSTVVESC